MVANDVGSCCLAASGGDRLLHTPKLGVLGLLHGQFLWRRASDISRTIDEVANARARPRSSRSADAARGGSKKKVLTFSGKELKAVLEEEFEWQPAMVRDLLKRLQRRKES